MERLRPYRHRLDHLGGDCGPPPSISGADGRPEHELAELLRFEMRYSRPHWHVLVRPRWAGRDASESGNMWQPLANLINCEEAAFKQAIGRSIPRPAPPTGRRRSLGGRCSIGSPTTTLAAWHCGPSLPAWARGLLDVVAYHRQTSVHLDS